MKTSIALLLVLLVCSIVKADLIHATATGPVNYIPNQSLPGPACPELGDEFMLDMHVQLDPAGNLVSGTFTGMLNGEHDGMPDGSTEFNTGPWKPWPQGDGWLGEGVYSRQRGGDAAVFFASNPHVIEWSWSVDGNWMCGAHMAPMSWSFLETIHDGDANSDELFDSTDLIQVFQAGEYEDGVARNSTWETGDWSGDKEFNSSDLVVAMISGHYSVPAASGRVQTPLGVLAVAESFSASDGVSAVPEPNAILLFSLGILLSLRRRK